MMKNRMLMLVCLASAQVALAGHVWQPDPAAAGPVKPENVRVVEQGIEHQRNGDGHVYAIKSFHRYKIEPDANGIYQIFPAHSDYTEYHDFDVDGDGRAANDTVGCHPFSMADTLTPDAPWYDTSIGNQKFYGGCTLYQANCAEAAGFSEDGMNDFEEGVGFQPRRNWTFFNENYDIFSPFRMYMVALWKKADFMNGGDQYPVSFDENSRLAYLVMRYFMGIDSFRFVVQNGDRFYISEKTYRGSGPTPGDNGGIAHTIYPAREKWAEYHPKAPYQIDFNPDGAEFNEVTFDDVQAFGWYLSKDKLESAYLGHKWYGFEADAVVHRPAQPSQNLAMSKVDNFYISKTEVPYELWRKVHRLKRSNTYVLERNYTFDKYGDLGSMDYSASLGRMNDAFSQDEPVTDVTLYDMLAWCNALSEQESKTPVYYIDPEFTEKFRQVRRSMLFKEPFELPKIYVNWAADGYRLPTPAEWNEARGQKTEDGGQKAEKTMPVGSGPANENGLVGMNGNVWEPVWTFGNVLDPSSNPDITLVGGDFLQSKNPDSVSASPWGDTPYDGSWNIGLRIVRRDPGLPGPASGSPSSPSWKLSKGRKTAEDTARQNQPVNIKLAAIPGEKVSLGTCEVNFAQWKQVFNWAVANGFTFDHGGEMGSMAYWGWGEDWKAGTHSPSEPVAGISHYDAQVWLNALSTMQGKTPVYYHDKALTKPYKTAYRFRPLMLWLGENTELRRAGVINHWWQEKDDVFEKMDADGFRLPATKEFEHAQFGGADAPDWNGDHASVAANAWLLESSGLRTHPCGELTPNGFGLYDMSGNVSEWTHDTNVGKNKGCVAERLGGGFFDPAVVQGASSVPAETTRGLMYPDVGLRVAVKNDGKGN